MATDFNKFVGFLRKRADNLANEARQRNVFLNTGSKDDGGATALRREIDAFEAGRQALLPAHWHEFRREFERENDPEYLEYMRLKEKFER